MYQSLDALIADLPRLAREHAAELAGKKSLFLFELREGRRVYVDMNGGQVTVGESSAAAPDTVITASEKDLMDMIAGKMNPMAALLRGKVQVKGNKKALLDVLALLK